MVSTLHQSMDSIGIYNPTKFILADRPFSFMTTMTGKYSDYQTYLDFKEKKGDLRAEDIRIVRAYMNEYVSQRGSSPNTALVNTQYIALLLERLPAPLSEITHLDILDAISRIRRDYRENSQRKFILNAKMLCEWMVKEGINSRINCEKVHLVKLPKKDLVTKKKATEILTPDEVRRIIGATRSSRDRAAISVLYEAALRSIEVTRLTWNDLGFDDTGIVVSTREKTGISRRIRMVTFTEYVSQWRNDYQGITGHAPEGPVPVFINIRGKPGAMSYQALKKVLVTAAERAGITGKHVHLHGLRHARITHMLESGVSETSVKKMAWGKTSTPMIAVYEHVSDEHVDNEVLEAAGLKKKDREKDRTLEAVACPSCATICPPGSGYCPKCGQPLTRQTIKSLKEKKQVILSSDEYQELIAMIEEYRKRSGK